MMGRPRKSGNKDLPSGMYRDAKGFKVRNPLNNKWVRLGSDLKAAKQVYDKIRDKWESDLLEAQHTRAVERLTRVAGNGRSFAEYATHYREQLLPTATGRDGKPLATKTANDYARMLRQQIETSELLAFPVEHTDAPTLRKFLSQWLDSPSMYNYLLAVLSRLCKRLVDEGVLDRDPSTDISRRRVGKRTTYVTNEDYVRIVSAMESGWHEALIDWIYLLSQNPTDCLIVQDNQVEVFDTPQKDEYGLIYADITIRRNKTGEAVTFGMRQDLFELYQYFLNEKRQAHIVSPYLIVWGDRAKTRRQIGQPVSSAYISKRFSKAVVAAGLQKGAYELRDLRSKGLTDEAVIAGKATEKGAHKTESMKQHYVRQELPRKVQSNISKIR